MKFWGYLFTRAFGLLLYIVVACSAADAQDVTPAEPLLLNPHGVAGDQHRKPDQPVAARITLRVAAAKPSGPVPEAKAEIEVLARVNSEEEVIVDRLPGNDVSSLARIVDDEGLSVGFFRTWSTKEDIWASARGNFQIYFLGGQGVFKRTGEMRCQKTGNDGQPVMSFHNGRWSAEARGLTFNVRATCESVDYFDGAGVREMMVLTGRSYTGKQGSWTEESARVQVVFDGAGEVVAAGLLKGDLAKAREAAKCVSTARSSASFVVCGPDGNGIRRTFWRHEERQVEYELECAPGPDADDIAVAQGKDFLAASCGMTYGEKGRKVWVEIASAGAPRGNVFQLYCSECETLSASRLHYVPERRELSFNIKTDAKHVEFEGGTFEIPLPLSSYGENRRVVSIPIFTVRMNENWQLIEVASAVDGAAQERAP